MSATSKDLESYLDVEERESRTIDTRNIRRLNRYILRHPWVLAGGVLMIFLGIGAALLEPRLFGAAIDQAIVPRDWERLKELTLLFLAVTCARVIAAISQGYLFELLGQRVTQDLRLELFAHLQRLPLSIFDKNPAGRLLTRVTNDISSLAEMFSMGFVALAGNVLMVIGILAFLITLNPKLGLISASVFPFLAIISAYFSKRLKIAYRESRSRLSALNAFFAENMLGIRVINLFNRQKLHLERFERINNWYSDAQIGTIRVFSLFQPSITLASGVAVGLLIWFGGVEAHSGSLQVGVLFAYFSYVLSLFQPMREIADKWNIFLSGMTSAERIFSILAWHPEPGPGKGGASGALELKGHIVFENVWFAYDGDHWILKDFSLEIPAGRKLAVVGHTGAGKTTLISLLMRFYEPQRGRILIDGKDIREYDRRALRASIGIVQQDVFLFSGTLADNVSFWGDSGSATAALNQVADNFALETELQERASNLSFGQRQVLSFARAVAAKPQIWILDEATSSMDSTTEATLHAALERASSGRTTIMIAHRLATVRSADDIIVLNKGVMVERGTHADLLRTDGLYARLYRYQQVQESLGSHRV